MYNPKKFMERKLIGSLKLISITNRAGLDNSFKLQGEQSGKNGNATGFLPRPRLISKFKLHI